MEDNMFVPNSTVKKMTWGVGGLKPRTKRFIKNKGNRAMRRALKLSVRKGQDVNFNPK